MKISSAHAKVFWAIKKGILKPPTEFDCVDCGKQATVYDHRNYFSPLSVIPVCHGCNLKRGPAFDIHLVSEETGLLKKQKAFRISDEMEKSLKELNIDFAETCRQALLHEIKIEYAKREKR